MLILVKVIMIEPYVSIPSRIQSHLVQLVFAMAMPRLANSVVICTTELVTVVSASIVRVIVVVPIVKVVAWVSTDYLRAKANVYPVDVMLSVSDNCYAQLNEFRT